MERFEGDFLKDKYWGNKEFRKAADVSARRIEMREDKTIPNTPQERIENYLDRFQEITDREDPQRRDHGIAAIERLVAAGKYIVKPENISDEYIKNILLGNEAELLGYEREDVKDEQIKQTVLASLENKIHSSLDTYTVPTELRESLETMVITDQKSRMKQWLGYLTGEEALHAPVALRYWAFAEMLKQGDYDPVRGEYNKRTDATVAIFPELDQQALALVFDEVERRRTGKASTLSIDDETRQVEFRELLKSENFGRLYAFMQKHVRSLKLPTERLVITEGEWRPFFQGSSAEVLTAPLQGFQTKWCIAGEGHAGSYLETSDVLIYFSKDAEGQNTIPRACIIDNKKHGITEVRGIIFNEEVKQHLDDYITPVVDEKLKTMEGGEKWSDKMEDMKKLRELHFKHLQKESFTKDDLTFLYEIDHPVQSSGYGTDPRIAKLRKGRDMKSDLSCALSVSKEQISLTKEEALLVGMVFHYGNLDLSGLTSAEGLTLPETIGGNLDLDGLTSAKGLTFPKTIGGNLDLSGLTSAEGLTLPETISGYLDLGGLTSAEGLTLSETISGDLYLNGLTSAKGLTFPKTIGGNLYLNGLTSAEGLTLPKTIGGNLYLNGLTSAEGLTLSETIGGNLYLGGLTSAKGLTFPETIGGGLDLSSLTSAKGLTFPETIGGGLDLGGLTSAEGLTFPETIGGGLDLGGLTSAKGLTLPETISGDLDLRGLTSAKGLTLPETIGGDLDLSSLTSAKGLTFPETIGGGLDLGGLTSAEGLTLPKTIGGDLDLSGLTSAEGLTLSETISGELYLNGLTSAEKNKLKERYPHLKL